MSLRSTVLGLSVICSSWACQPKDLSYNQEEEIIRWPKSQTVAFENVTVDSGKEATLHILHSKEYGFENIYLESITTVAGDTIQKNVFSVPLMTSEGIWKGTQKGDHFEVAHSITTYIEAVKDATILINQYSRENILDGVQSLRLSIKK